MGLHPASVNIQSLDCLNQKIKARIYLNSKFVTKKVSLTSWITLEEFSKYLRLAIWACREKEHATEYQLLIRRIRKLVKTNGWNFAFKYLKECLRLVVLYLAGTPSTSRGRNAIGVRVNQYGLPVIIPSPLRALLRHEGDTTTTRTLLTVLSIFRVFPTKVKPDLGTITAPHSGITLTLEGIQDVAKSLVRGRLKSKPIKGFISESAGPIDKSATMGSPFDAFALLGYPTVALSVLRSLLSKGGLAYTISLCSLWAIYIIPYVLLRVSFGHKYMFPLGRLAVVYDQAGKARIVALVNWWIQMALKPFHESLFEILDGIESDGTFDQIAPLRRLMAAPLEGHKFSCYDLSAATDRLPMQIQKDVITAIGGDASIWSKLLTFPYYYKGEPVMYSVGQPMGAYSSWPMLALTHHCIVRLAAVRAGVKNFTSYAVLGDDVVINHDKVAAEYTSLMNSLGVEINLGKSVVSDRIAEFAKRLVSPAQEISPIGPGVLLESLRRPAFIGSLLVEITSKGVYDAYGVGWTTLFKDLPHRSGLVEKYVWTYIMTCKALMPTRSTTPFGAVDNTSGELRSQLNFSRFNENLYSVLRFEVRGELLAAYHTAKAEEKRFHSQFYKLKAQNGVVKRFIQVVGLPLSPWFYLYWFAFLRSTELIRCLYIDLQTEGWNPPGVLDFLAKYSDYPLLTVGRRPKVQKEQARFVKKVTVAYLALMKRTWS